MVARAFTGNINSALAGKKRGKGGGLQGGDLSENHGQRSPCALRASLLCKSEGGRGGILETDPLELYLKDPGPYKSKRGTGACRAGPSGSDQ